MSDAGKITKLLVDRITEREEPNRRRLRANPFEEKNRAFPIRNNRQR